MLSNKALGKVQEALTEAAKRASRKALRDELNADSEGSLGEHLDPEQDGR